MAQKYFSQLQSLCQSFSEVTDKIIVLSIGNPPLYIEIVRDPCMCCMGHIESLRSNVHFMQYITTYDCKFFELCNI